MWQSNCDREWIPLRQMPQGDVNFAHLSIPSPRDQPYRIPARDTYFRSAAGSYRAINCFSRHRTRRESLPGEGGFRRNCRVHPDFHARPAVVDQCQRADIAPVRTRMHAADPRPGQAPAIGAHTGAIGTTAVPGSTRHNAEAIRPATASWRRRCRRIPRRRILGRRVRQIGVASPTARRGRRYRRSPERCDVSTVRPPTRPGPTAAVVGIGAGVPARRRRRTAFSTSMTIGTTSDQLRQASH